jgi:hypothetical protein
VDDVPPRAGASVPGGVGWVPVLSTGFFAAVACHPYGSLWWNTMDGIKHLKKFYVNAISVYTLNFYTLWGVFCVYPDKSTCYKRGA